MPGRSPLPSRMWNAPPKFTSSRHLAHAALNWTVLVSIPSVSSTGPLPVGFKTRTSTPFRRTHAANCKSV